MVVLYGVRTKRSRPGLRILLTVKDKKEKTLREKLPSVYGTFSGMMGLRRSDSPLGLIDTSSWHTSFSPLSSGVVDKVGEFLRLVRLVEIVKLGKVISEIYSTSYLSNRNLITGCLTLVAFFTSYNSLLIIDLVSGVEWKILGDN